MMDLLVHITTCHKLSPPAHVLQPYGERGILPYKPSTPIGALDTVMVHVVPKKQLAQNQSNKMALKQASQPFEQTYRIQVSLPRNQLYVLRANGRTTIGDIHSEICSEKNLDPNKYSLRHPKELSLELKSETTIAEYKSNQLVLVSNKASPANQLSTDEIINAIHNINSNNNNNIYAFEPSSRSLSPDSSVSPVAEPPKPFRKKKPPAPKPPSNNQPTLQKSKDKNQGVEGSTGRVICHSRTSSDSSGYHEASLLSESPPSNNSSLPDSLPRRSKLDSKLKASSRECLTAGTGVQQNQSLSKSLVDLKAHHAESSASGSMPPAQSQSSLKPAQSTTSLNTGRKKRAAPPPPPSVPTMRTLVEERINGDSCSENEPSSKERSRTLEPERKVQHEPAEKSRTLPPGLSITSVREDSSDNIARDSIVVSDNPDGDVPVVPIAPPVARPRSFVRVQEDDCKWETDGCNVAHALPEDRRRLEDFSASSRVPDERITVLECIEENSVEAPKVVKRTRVPVPRKRNSLGNELDKTVKPEVTPRLSMNFEPPMLRTSNAVDDSPIPPVVKRRSLTQESLCLRTSICSDEKYYSADSESEEMSSLLSGCEGNTGLTQNISQINVTEELIRNPRDELPHNEHHPVVRAIPIQIIDDSIKDEEFVDESQNSKVTIIEVVPSVDKVDDTSKHSGVKIVAATRKGVQSSFDAENFVINSDAIDTDEDVVIKTVIDVSEPCDDIEIHSDELKCDINENTISIPEVMSKGDSRHSSDDVVILSRKEEIFDDGDFGMRTVKRIEVSEKHSINGRSMDEQLIESVERHEKLMKSQSAVFNSALGGDLMKEHDFGNVRVKLKQPRPFSFGEWGASDIASALRARRKSLEDSINNSFSQARSMFENTEKSFFGEKAFPSNRRFINTIDEDVYGPSKHDINTPEEDSGVEITEVIDFPDNCSDKNTPKSDEFEESQNSPLISEPVEEQTDVKNKIVLSLNDKVSDGKGLDVKMNNDVESPPKINWARFPSKSVESPVEESTPSKIVNSPFRPKSASSIRCLLKSFEGSKTTDEKLKSGSASTTRTFNNIKNEMNCPVEGESSQSISSSSKNVKDDVFVSSGRIRSFPSEVQANKPRPVLREVESTGDLEILAKSLTGSRLRKKWPPKPNLSDERDLVMEDDEIDRIFNSATAEHGSLSAPSPIAEANDSGRDSSNSNDGRSFTTDSSLKKMNESNKILSNGLPSPVKVSMDDAPLDFDYKLPAPPTFRDPPYETPKSPESIKKMESVELTPRSAVMSELSSVISQRSTPTTILTKAPVEEIVENSSNLDNFKITTYAPKNSTAVSVRRNNSLVRNNGIGPTASEQSNRENSVVKRSVSHVSLFERPTGNNRSRTLDRNQDKFVTPSSVNLRKTSSEFNIDSVGKKERPHSYADSQGLQSIQVLRSILPQLSQSQGSLNTIAEAESIKQPEPVQQKQQTRYERDDKIAVSLGTWGERPKRQVSIKSDRDYVFGQGGLATLKKTSNGDILQCQDSSSTSNAVSSSVADTEKHENRPYHGGFTLKKPLQSDFIRQEAVSLPVYNIDSVQRKNSFKKLEEEISEIETSEILQEEERKAKRVANVYKCIETGNTKPLRQILSDVSRVPVVKSVELKAPYKMVQNRGLDRLKERFESDSGVKTNASPEKEVETFESTDKIREKFESAIKERYEITGKMLNRRDIPERDPEVKETTTKININQTIDPESLRNQTKFESKVQIQGPQTCSPTRNKMISQTKIELNDNKTVPLMNRYTSVIGIGGADEVVRVRVKTSTGKTILPAQNPQSVDPRQQLLTSIRGFGGIDSLKKVRS